MVQPKQIVMETKVIIFEVTMSNREDQLNERIREEEVKGYAVFSVNCIEGNVFSKYTCNPTIVVTLKK